jgi:hypothetical protein
MVLVLPISRQVMGRRLLRCLGADAGQEHVTDENSNSAIGGDDFALAFVDEIERPVHHRRLLRMIGDVKTPLADHEDSP